METSENSEALHQFGKLETTQICETFAKTANSKRTNKKHEIGQLSSNRTVRKKTKQQIQICHSGQMNKHESQNAADNRTI